jgi:hypothetical protein
LGGQEVTTVIFYTDNSLPEWLSTPVWRTLKQAVGSHPFVSVSWRPVELGKNIVIGEGVRAHLTLYKQILAGCVAADTDTVALAEHDVLYTPEHFDWQPPDLDTFYYNLSCWFVNAKQGDSSFGKYSSPWGVRHATSQLICGRDLLIKNVRERIEKLEEGWTIRKGQRGACEPGVEEEKAFVRLHDDGILMPRRWNAQWISGVFATKQPNVDIRHGGNLTGWRRGHQSTFDLQPWGKLQEALAL